MVKLVVLEDCHLFCEGIRSWLGDERSIVLQEPVRDWNSYTGFARELNDFITITSMHWIKSYPGIEAFSSFHKDHPSINVFCINLKDDDLRSIRPFDAEIKGFVTRRATKEEFIFGLKEVIKGRFYISTEQKPVEVEAINGTRQDVKFNVPSVSLSKREIQILNLISKGFSDKEISSKLDISKRTVDGYRHNLLMKFGARNSPNLVNYAIAGNYISGIGPAE